MISNACARVVLLVAIVFVFLAPGASAARPGALDRSFGDRGRIVFELPGERAVFAAVAVQPDGKIVAAGSLADGHPFAVRFLPEGGLDDTFGAGGVTRPAVPMDGVRGLAIQPDGKLLLAGSAARDRPGDIGAVVRLLPDGDVDQGFGNDGFAVVHPEGTWARFGPTHLSELALLPDGRILAAGEQRAYDVHDATNVLVARLLPHGEPDTTFDGNGTAWSHMKHPTAVVVRPDGEAVVLGWNPYGFGESSLFAMRFGSGPTVTPEGSPFHEGASYGFRHQPIGSAATLRADGTIVFVADLEADRNRGTLVWLRLAPDLELLERHVVAGDGAQAAGFDARGALIAGGRVRDNPLAAFGLRRYRGRGLARDPSFGARRGRTTVDVEDPSSLIAVVPHGNKVLVAGVTRPDGRTASPLTLFRLHAHRDTKDPAVSVRGLAPPRFCIAGSPTVLVIARDAGQVRALVRIDGRRVERSRRRRTVVEIDATELAPGRHTLTAIARDAARNRTRVDRIFRVCRHGVS